MKTLLMHLGLGDCIVLSGAIVTLSRKHGGIRVPCWQHNETSVRSFFVNHPEVEVWAITNETDMFCLLFKEGWIATGYYNKDKPVLPGEGFDAWFYRQLGLPLELRWDACPIRDAATKVVQTEALSPKPYAFLHDDMDRNFNITGDRYPKLPVVCPEKEGSVMGWSTLLENAAEVHVINSAFFHLAECLQPKGKLFYHRYARPGMPIDQVTTRLPWEVF